MAATSRRAQSLFSPGEQAPTYPKLHDLVSFSYNPGDTRNGYVTRIFRSGSLTVFCTKRRDLDRGREHLVHPKELLAIHDESLRMQEQPGIF